MEATRRHREVIPQLTLRFYDGQDPRLMRKALDVLAEGGTYPMLYNDDVNVPGVARALNVSEEDALRYHPLGCGEYMIACASPSLLNVSWSVPKSLEAAMRDGLGMEGRRIGPPNEGIDVRSGFGALNEALDKQLAYAADLAARVHAKNNAVVPGECSFLFASLLTDDCLERGRAMFDGGARTIGACIMGHGFTNVADSLLAVRRMVYEEKSVEYDELLEALESNFEDAAPLHRLLQAQPKYGNDDEEADALVVDLWRRVTRAAADAGARVGLDFLTVSSVNPGGFGLGRECGATPDGRSAGQPFAIGNAPSAGRDTNGITAMLKSVARVDPACGGSTTNIKLGKNIFAEGRPQLDALLDAYWQQGGMQAMLTVVSQAELEDAMAHPERYPHLMVRVGGWSAKFISLDREIQQEIVCRTLY
jgi:pyruvate-formate lyase